MVQLVSSPDDLWQRCYTVVIRELAVGTLDPPCGKRLEIAFMLQAYILPYVGSIDSLKVGFPVVRLMKHMMDKKFNVRISISWTFIGNLLVLSCSNLLAIVSYILF